MLQPKSDRLDYGNLLMPPEGYKLDNAIATSYSLDLDALISIPVALYFSQTLDLDLKANIVQVLDSIRRASDTVKVFCQKGQIKVPETQHRLYSFIEPCVVQVSPTQQKSFHPKIWVIRYKNNHQEIKYRVIVLSRNLTFDRSWDVAFQIEGDCIQNRQNNFRNTKPLIDFINHLLKYEEVAWSKLFISDLGKTEFKIIANEFEEFKFIPTGFKGYRKNILFDKNVYDDLLIISPFVTNGGLEVAEQHSTNKPTLFSREYELKKLNEEILNKFDVYHLSNDFVEGEERIDVDTEENVLSQLQDLHAKVYSYKKGWDAYLLLGSVNCSKRGMENNVEFMIQLKGKNSKMGPNIIFDELVNKDLQIFQQYLSTEKLSTQEKQIEELEHKLQYLKTELVNTILDAKALKQEDSNFKVNFEFNLKGIKVDPDIDITANLLNTEHIQTLRLGENNIWAVHNISELDLSCFLVLELKSKRLNVVLKFAIKIDIKNLPTSRNTRIFRDIISSSSNFFKYIRFLLAENYWDEQLSFGVEKGDEFDESTDGYSFNEEPIYESMLKAISREPEKLTEIKKIMDKLSEEDNTNTSIIPADFKELWCIFDEINKKTNDIKSK